LIVDKKSWRTLLKKKDNRFILCDGSRQEIRCENFFLETSWLSRKTSSVLPFEKKDKAFTAYDGLQPVLAGMNRSFLTDEQQLATFFSAANGRLTATLVDGPRDRTRNLLSKDAGSNPTV